MPRPSHGQAPHDLPDRIDPYEIAYLRGGTNELARVVIVGLVERQLLELTRPDGGLSRFVCVRTWSLACSGMPMRQEEIHGLMDQLNQPKLAHVLPTKRSGGDPPNE